MALSIRPRCVSARSHLRWWLDSGRMRSLIDGVGIKLLTRLRHHQSSPQSQNPKARCRARVSRPEGTAASKACSFSLYSQAQKTCDDYDHDHHTDDVKDVHCVLLRLRDAHLLEGRQICDWVHPGSSCHGCQSVVEAIMRSSTDVSLCRIAHCNLLRSELCLPHTGPLSDHAIIQSAALCTKSLARGQS
jgi:hypothetical protein